MNHLLVSPRGNLGVHFAAEAVAAFGDSDELVGHGFGGEFLVHLDGKFVRNVGVFCAVNEQRVASEDAIASERMKVDIRLLPVKILTEGKGGTFLLWRRRDRGVL